MELSYVGILSLLQLLIWISYFDILPEVVYKLKLLITLAVVAMKVGMYMYVQGNVTNPPQTLQVHLASL